MSVDAPVRARATESIRAALAAELPPDAWSVVKDLVERIGAAVDLGDSVAVGRLTADLDAVRGAGRPPATPAGPLPPSPGVAPPMAAGPPPSPSIAPPSMAPPPGPRPPAGRPGRRRPLVLVAVALVVVAAIGGVALTGGGDDEDRAGFERPDEEQTTTTEEDEQFDTTALVEETTTTEAIVLDPPEDLGTLAIGSDGRLLVVLSWRSGADLDLRVVEPDGTQLALEDPGPSATGGEHLGDTEADCDGGRTTATEVVEWTAGATAGRYEILVDGFDVDGCGDGTFELTVDAGSELVTTVGTAATGRRQTITFVGVGGAPPPVGVTTTTTSTTTTTAPSTTVPATTEDTGVDVGAGDGDDEDDTPVAALLAVGLLAAAAGGAITWVAGRRRLPVLTGSQPLPEVIAAVVRPRLPVPAELRELANHTIHRLEMGPS